VAKRRFSGSVWWLAIRTYPRPALDGLPDVGDRWNPRRISETTGFRVYPPDERPDVEVRVDKDCLPAEIPLLGSPSRRLVGELQLAPRDRGDPARHLPRAVIAVF